MLVPKASLLQLLSSFLRVSTSPCCLWPFIYPFRSFFPFHYTSDPYISVGISTIFISLMVPLIRRPILQESFLIRLATFYLRAVLISICFLNIILLLKYTPRYLIFLLVLTTLPYTISSPYKIGALLLLKTIASILISSISSPSSLTSLASLLASLLALNRTCLSVLLKALTAILLAYLYLFPFPFLIRTLLSSRLNSTGNTGDP